MIETTTEPDEAQPEVRPTGRESGTVAIEVVGVSKTFRKHSEPAKTLKERLITLRQSTVETFHALDDVDFRIYTGETFGILGHNGSGKSTLLKCIAGTIRPSQGVVRVRGRLSALLELGAGFHPDLTGRENVYLNGSILGFSRQRIDQIFDEIVAFAGLEGFIDTQVKHYSSGMYARLGFAVAVNVQPDVLLIDEVLAVGDEAFQRKCIERIRGFQNDGRTMCIVTHSPDMVRHLCDQALVLDHGRMLHLGDVNEAISIYRRSLADQGHEVPAEDAAADLVGETADQNRNQDNVRILDCRVEPPSGGGEFHRPGERVEIVVRYQSPEPVPLRSRLLLHSHDGMSLLDVSSYDVTGTDLAPVSGTGSFRFVLDDLPLADGTVLVTIVLQRPDETAEYDRQDQKTSFDIRSGGPVWGRVVVKVDFKQD